MSKRITQILDNLYLYLSDCDGMCNFCNADLKTKCDKRKNKVNESETL
jgi:hypothetical protein